LSCLQFLSQDRVGVLLNNTLQDVLESVLFEPRDWVAQEAKIEMVGSAAPMTLSELPGVLTRL
jgi:hypothetical protein